MDVETMIGRATLGPDFPLPPQLRFTVQQAAAAGISRRVLERLTDTGLVRRPIRSVYLATELGDSLRLRAECLRLVAPEDASGERVF